MPHAGRITRQDAHQHGDRSPSCSVNLTSGAWNCHGCGAAAGAYDAALAVGHIPRSAIDLMVAHGLTERRSVRGASPQMRSGVSQTVMRVTATATPPPTLDVTTTDVQRWRENLGGDGRL